MNGSSAPDYRHINPATWLAGHDPGADSAAPFLSAHDVLRLGADELARHGGDLSRALFASPDCRAEILLAWLEGAALEHGTAAATDGIMLAARIVGRLNARA